MSGARAHGSLRSRLFWIVGTAALALIVTLIGSAVIGAQQTRGLRDMEQRLVPKLELRPKLEAEFDHLRQAMQDAVSAQDPAALAASLEIEHEIFDTIGASGGVLEPNDAALLRWTVHDYYETARDVSRRLIAGETGEELVEVMARMQAQQARTSAVIKRTTGLNRNELASSFAAVVSASQRADRFRFAIGLIGLALVLAFSFSVSASVLNAIGHLSRGLSRFAVGQFGDPIPEVGLEELAKLAHEANQMASELRQLAEQRDRHDWLKESQVQLSEEMRGDAELQVLADRIVRCLAGRTGAVAAALYLLEDGGLALRGRYAAPDDTPEVVALEPLLAESAPGQGLLVEAMRAPRLLVIEDVPRGYLKISSGLGEAAATSLVFLPLARADETLGVLELALFKACSSDIRELLESVQEMLVIALQAARSRAALREALNRSQKQAERLAAQEEELRANNQELQAQHEELRAANAELEAQGQTLSQQNEELEEARSRLQQKAEELSKMSSYKSQFLANMSHELRTPLNSMLLLSHLLAQNETGNLSPKQVEYGKTIHSAGGDLLNLINQVLDLAKIEAGRQEVRIEAAPLRNFAEHARRVFEPLATEKQLDLEIEVDPDLPAAIRTDAGRVERILTNLLGNAIKFTDRGRVTLRIARPAAGAKAQRPDLDVRECVALSVTDTGIGIAEADRARIFAPFEQIESHSNRRYSGTGLGLAIARESAQLLGGELRLESQVGQGSTFTCYLPLSPLEEPRESRARSSRAPARFPDDRAELNADTPHLLVIEDDPVMVEQLVEIVRDRRLKVVVAATGEEGIELARSTKPQGIILDVTLPDIDGWDVMSRLRSQASTREIPVHFVSAVDAPARGLALGAVGYLMKPASHAELAQAVRALSPAPRDAAQSILIVEDSVAEGESLRELLAREDFEAERVGSAQAALDLLEKRRFGCMILDLGLPDMDGLAVLETLRARGTEGAPRVIVHTGRALNKRETQQLEAYAEAVVLKEGNSSARLLEELRLFVNHVKGGLSSRARSQIPPAGSSFDVSLAGKKILIAEDDMRTVYALSALLTSKGADVLLADTGRAAIELIDGNPDVDIVLMDIMMPEMDGYEATRKLRRDARFRALPIVALTAKAMKGERDRCLEAGASDYLTKPVDTDKLLQTLQGYLSEAAPHGV